MKANLGAAATYEYPYNLVSDVLGAQHMGEWKEHEPPDSLETIESLLSELSPREAKILRYRYQDKLTYSDIAKLEDRTVERMRQIISKALRQLKRPSKRNRILYGNALAAEKADEQRRREKVIFYAKTIADTLAAKSAQERYSKKRKQVMQYHHMTPTQQAKYIIEHDGLKYSNALFPNLIGEVLWINRIQYIWQLVLYSELDLKRLIKLSSSDVRTIREKLNTLGLDLSPNNLYNNLTLYTKLKEEFVRMASINEEE